MHMQCYNVLCWCNFQLEFYTCWMFDPCGILHCPFKRLHEYSKKYIWLEELMQYIKHLNWSWLIEFSMINLFVWLFVWNIILQIHYIMFSTNLRKHKMSHKYKKNQSMSCQQNDKLNKYFVTLCLTKASF